MKSKPMVSPKPWRVNYTVTYLDKPARHLFREKVHSVLKNVAWLRNIDCAIVVDFSMWSAEYRADNEWLKDASLDLVYFRSTPQTTTPAKEFRALIDALFSEHRFLDYSTPVEVGRQLQSALKNFPFPTESSRFPGV